MMITFQWTMWGHTMAMAITLGATSEEDDPTPDEESSHGSHNSDVGMYPQQAHPITGFAWNPSVDPTRDEAPTPRLPDPCYPPRGRRTKRSET